MGFQLIFHMLNFKYSNHCCDVLNYGRKGEECMVINEVVNTEHESILSQAQQHIALQKMVLRAGGVNLPGVGTGPTTTAETPTKVLCLTELITADELMDDGEYEEILEDMREEGENLQNLGECLGVLVNAIIPRPSPNGGEQVPGVGKHQMEPKKFIMTAPTKKRISDRRKCY